MSEAKCHIPSQLQLFKLDVSGRFVPSCLVDAPILQQDFITSPASQVEQGLESSDSSASVPVWLPYVKISPTYACVYYKREPCLQPHENFLNNRFQSGSSNNRYTGQLNDKSLRRMRQSFEMLRVLSERLNKRLQLVTLTLASPQGEVNDRAIKRELLNHFLVVLRRKWGIAHYIWRAERQRNGNIHFHVVVLGQVDNHQVRKVWNVIQEKLGYVRKYSEKFNAMSWQDYLSYMTDRGTYEIRKLRNWYRAGTSCGWTNPPSTRVDEVYELDGASDYLMKYASKQAKDGEFIDGKVWGCSKSLQGGVSCELFLSEEISAALLDLECSEPSKVIRNEGYTYVPRSNESSMFFGHPAVRFRFQAKVRLIVERGERDIANVRARVSGELQRSIDKVELRDAKAVQKRLDRLLDKFGGSQAKADFLRCSMAAVG